MPVKTYAEQLEAVQTAIADIEKKNQSYTTGEGRSVTKATLRDLYDREKYLRRMVAREAAGGGVIVRYGVPQ